MSTYQEVQVIARVLGYSPRPVLFILKVFPGQAVPTVLLVNNHLLKLFDPGSLAQFPLHTSLSLLCPPIPLSDKLVCEPAWQLSVSWIIESPS